MKQKRALLGTVFVQGIEFYHCSDTRLLLKSAIARKNLDNNNETCNFKL